MKFGSRTVHSLSGEEARRILLQLCDDCVEYAGESYEDFSRAAIDTLHGFKLVDYGYSSERYQVTPLTSEEYVGRWGIFDTKDCELYNFLGTVCTYSKKEEAKDVCFELNEKEEELEND